VRYPVRTAAAAWSVLTAPLAVLLVVWMLGSSAGGAGRGLLVGLLAGGLLFVLHFRRARRRALTVTDDGVELQYDDYRLVAPWSALRMTQKAGWWGLTHDVLHVDEATVLALDGDGEPTSISKRMTAQKVRTTVRLGDFDRDWRDGPLGRLVPADA
jgi:hypothetical protein